MAIRGEAGGWCASAEGRASAHPLLRLSFERMERWEVPCTAGGWVGVGTPYSPSAGRNGAYPPSLPRVASPSPTAATPPRIHTGLLNPPRPACSGLGSALSGRRWKLGRPQPGWRQAQASPAGGAPRVSGGSENSRRGCSWGRDVRAARPGGFGAPALFLIIGANGVLYSLNPTHMVS